MMLNAAVAESLRQYADELEQAPDRTAALHDLIQRVIRQHKRIIFNGNGYDDAWLQEAQRRGLLNLRTTPDAMPQLLDPKNTQMLTAHKVFTQAELLSRYEIMLDNYVKTVCVEAQTMCDMARRQILPAVEQYAARVARAAADKRALDETLPCGYERRLTAQLSALTDRMDGAAGQLEETIAQLKTLSDVTEAACFIRDRLLARMTELRAAADEAEVLTAAVDWPFPTYGELLFGVRRGTKEEIAGLDISEHGLLTAYTGFATLLPKIQVDLVVSKVPVRTVVETAKKVLYTGHIGDGKIFVYDVENVIKVRTGEEGCDALQDVE